MLAAIPTLWTDTRVLDARSLTNIVVLRQAGDGAFRIGAMTDWTPRVVTVPLQFPPVGSLSAEVWQDGPNAARYGADWRHVVRPVTASDARSIRMAPGGGYVARITGS